MNMIDIIKRQLVGKSLKHRNQYGREVSLIIEDVIFEKHEYDLEPSTAANDWWPATSTSVSFVIKFSDGSSIKLNPTQELNIN